MNFKLVLVASPAAVYLELWLEGSQPDKGFLFQSSSPFGIRSVWDGGPGGVEFPERTGGCGSQDSQTRQH